MDYCQLIYPKIYFLLLTFDISYLFLFWQLTGLTDSDKEALVFIVKAAAVMDEIFYLQVIVLLCTLCLSNHIIKFDWRFIVLQKSFYNFSCDW